MEDIERWTKEKNYLEKVKELIRYEIVKLEQDLVEIPKQYRKRYSDVAGGDEDLVDSLIAMTKNRINKLELTKKNCYFGQFSFTDDLIGKCEKFYVGKTTISDNIGNVFTLDWRAPVCSLYYDQKMDNVSYISNGEKYTGKLVNKSQIKISDGELIDIVDTDSVTSDELIVSFLKQSVGNKMKDIVASIQHEQNKIIRFPFNKNLIIQGVAGSGKTSVALHRVAYLLYNEKKYKPEQFLVIGPNSCFNDYISMVLPSLDSEGIQQLTYIDLLKKCINIKINDINQETNLEIASYKTSLKYKDDIDQFINDYISSIKSSVNFEGFEIVSNQKIKSYLMSSTGTLKQKFDMVIAKTANYIKDYADNIENALREDIKNGNFDLKGESPFSFYQRIRKELKNGCKNIIKKELYKYYVKPVELYKKFLEDFDIYCYKLDNSTINELKKSTLKNLNNKIITEEDISALLYLNNIISPNELFENIVHVIVDEAQDYGLFNFYMIKTIFPNSTYSIFGDLAQSIYSYKSIENWDILNKNIFDDKADILNLNQSYRTTQEISLEANKILDFLCLDNANPVLRNGEEVNYDVTDNIHLHIINMKNKGYNSIAILCKDEEEVNDKYIYLKKIFPEITKINSKDNNYEGGLCIIDVKSAKGLEFDAAIISDASENRYNSEEVVDYKKLYVAMTRSLHELVICSNGDLTLALKKEKKKQLKK